MHNASRVLLAIVLAVSGLGLALYEAYVDRVPGSYLAIIGTVIFMGGLFLFTIQPRAGASSPSHP
jgi:hypothetical protein